MILSLLATVAVLAALVVIAAALVLAEPTLVYFALGLGGLSVLLLLGALIQGRFGGSSSDTARTDGLGKSSVPVVAAASAVGAVPGTQWEPEYSGRVPAPAEQPVRESAVTKPPVSTGHALGESRVAAAEENEEEAEFEVPRWQTPTMGSWPEPVVEPEAGPKPEEHSEKTETVPEPDGSDEPPRVEETPEREAPHEAAPDPIEVEDAWEPVAAVAQTEPVREPETSAIEPERAQEQTSVEESPAEETTADAASLPESDDEAHAQQPVQEDRAPGEHGPEDLESSEAPDHSEDVEASLAYAALLDTRDDDPEETELRQVSEQVEPEQDPQIVESEAEQDTRTVEAETERAGSEQVEPEQEPQIVEAESSQEALEAHAAPESAREDEDEPVHEEPEDASAQETDTPEGPEEPQDRVEDSGRTREPDSSLSA
ncbi:hypothetical protein [Nocardiopsis sp. SBT366]|uniref:hypothetical protein n=1 Tax=Nocardiopsis sp. SBT366 TaxID=1580529 RepID=UPI00066BB325|nr:hypothetical protein [Nocardiopsis sp. SBT366]